MTANSGEPIRTDSDGTVVPVDLSGWFSGDPEQMDRVAREVDQACAGSGFLAITGHGISPSLMERMLDTIQAFFDLPLETKLRSTLEDLTRNRGYTPPESEALSYSLGVESPPDLFEAFNIGREVPPPGESAEASDTYFSQNVWPDEPAGMRETFLEYWDACETWASRCPTSSPKRLSYQTGGSGNTSIAAKRDANDQLSAARWQ